MANRKWIFRASFMLGIHENFTNFITSFKWEFNGMIMGIPAAIYANQLSHMGASKYKNSAQKAYRKALEENYGARAKLASSASCFLWVVKALRSRKRNFAHQSGTRKTVHPQRAPRGSSPEIDPNGIHKFDTKACLYSFMLLTTDAHDDGPHVR